MLDSGLTVGPDGGTDRPGAGYGDHHRCHPREAVRHTGGGVCRLTWWTREIKTTATSSGGHVA